MAAPCSQAWSRGWSGGPSPNRFGAFRRVPSPSFDPLWIELLNVESEPNRGHPDPVQMDRYPARTRRSVLYLLAIACTQQPTSLDLINVGLSEEALEFRSQDYSIMSQPDLFVSLGPVVLMQLHACLRSLDAVGADVAAAHVSSAIDTLHGEFSQRGLQSILDETLGLDFSILDRMIDTQLCI